MSIEGGRGDAGPARGSARRIRFVFGGFSRKSLQERIIDAGAVAVITADEQQRGARRFRSKPSSTKRWRWAGARASATSSCTGARRQHRLQAPRDLWLHELVAKQADTCEPEWVGAEHPLFIFTVGLHRQTKGVQHSSPAICCGRS
jgi:acetyl-CoA synthetase